MVSESHLQQASREEKTQPRTSASETKPISSPYIEKIERTFGDKKVNVRIFKEPVTTPRVTEPPKETEIKRVDVDALLLRLKKDFSATAIRPTTPNPHPKQIILVQE